MVLGQRQVSHFSVEEFNRWSAASWEWITASRRS